MGSAGEWLVELILQPGTSTRLVPAINVTLIGLLLVLGGVTIYGQGSIHIAAMGLLACGLMASVNWFIVEFEKVKREQQTGEAGSTGPDGAAGGGASASRSAKQNGTKID